MRIKLLVEKFVDSQTPDEGFYISFVHSRLWIPATASYTACCCLLMGSSILLLSPTLH
jgi:hypothetical protein